MRFYVIPSILAMIALPAAAQQAQDGIAPTPAALELFERDWLLMDWALRFFDSDTDVTLSAEEAEAAAAEFKKLADADGDDRVTEQEFEAARRFILARY